MNEVGDTKESAKLIYRDVEEIDDRVANAGDDPRKAGGNVGDSARNVIEATGDGMPHSANSGRQDAGR